jgi:diamine N-acetyltransferase
MEKPSTEWQEQVSIRPLTRFNWEQALTLELHDYQDGFLPPVLHSIAQSKFENLFPYGIFVGDHMAGFVMYGEFSGVCWVSRIMVDKAYQQRGIGTIALQHLLDLLKVHPKCREIRTSFGRDNALAEYFFRKAKFALIGDGLDNEIVMRYVGKEF